MPKHTIGIQVLSDTCTLNQKLCIHILVTHVRMYVCTGDTAVLVEDFLATWKKLYTERTFTPKIHYLLNLPHRTARYDFIHMYVHTSYTITGYMYMYIWTCICMYKYVQLFVCKSIPCSFIHRHARTHMHTHE